MMEERREKTFDWEQFEKEAKGREKETVFDNGSDQVYYGCKHKDQLGLFRLQTKTWLCSDIISIFAMVIVKSLFVRFQKFKNDQAKVRTILQKVSIKNPMTITAVMDGSVNKTTCLQEILKSDTEVIILPCNRFRTHWILVVIHIDPDPDPSTKFKIVIFCCCNDFI